VSRARCGARTFWRTLALACALGAAIRLAAALVLAPAYGYLPDHLDNMGWSLYAYEHGAWSLYDAPPGSPLLVRTADSGGRPALVAALSRHAYNYPPGSAYLFCAKGWIWTRLDGERVQVSAGPGGAGASAVSLPVLNTPGARLADASASIAFDFLLAFGVAALVRALRPDESGERRAAAAAALALLAPPIFLDSAFWIQQDSWVASLLVWTLVLLLRQRFVWAGALYGLALMTKPQAILLGPVLAYVAVALRFAPGGSWGRALHMGKLVAAAAVVVVAIAAPFAIADARRAGDAAGALRWFERSYVSSIGDDQYARTTLAAFNLWWLDYLADSREAAPLPQVLSDEAERLGLSKHTWGWLLLSGGVLLAFVSCGRGGRFAPESWLACAFLVSFAAFVLPTRVHERYVYYCIPFAIALAVHRRAWVPALLALLVVGTAEMVSFHFAFRPEARFATGLLAVLTLGAFAYACGVPFLRGAGSLRA
jgi:hypothetical protein